MDQSIRIRHWVYTAIIVLLCTLAITLRTYKWTDMTVFNGDDGMDLSVVWNMEYRGHRPLVGPFLSVPGIYTPPTYYYLTWIFYHIIPTPDAVRIGYLIMNLSSMLILIVFLRNIGGKTSAVIGAILYATSSTLIHHGRAFWQPFPIQFFLSLTLLFLWYAHTNKSSLCLWIASFFYTIAASVYPSPIILLPFMMYHLMRWHYNIQNNSWLRAATRSALMLISTGVVVFLPQIIFEYNNHFPTLRTIFSSESTTLFREQPWTSLFWHVMTSVTAVIPTIALVPQRVWPMIPAVAIVLLVYIYRVSAVGHTQQNKRVSEILGFFPPHILALGFMSVVIITDYAPQRVWAMIPILISYISLVAARGLRNNASTAAAAIIILHLYTNGTVIYQDITHWGANGIQQTKYLSERVASDMDTHHLSQSDISVHYVLQDNSSYHYQLYRIIYWLIETEKMSIPMTSDGNALSLLTYDVQPTQPTAYLFCEHTALSDDSDCLENFIRVHTKYSLRDPYHTPHLSLYILSKK